MPRTAEQKKAISEATTWTLQQMADEEADDVSYSDLVERFGISLRAAHEIATATGFHRVNQHMLTDVNEEDRTATCSICGPTKVWKRNREYGRVSWTCYTKGTERNRKYLSGGARAHGLNKNQARRLREGRTCEVPVCNKPAEAVDHCHDTLNIRGVLCRDHNLALGHVHDSIEELEGLIDYLKMTTGVDGLERLGYAG